MVDNTDLAVPAGSTTGDKIRDIDRAGVKTQVVQLDIGGAVGEQLVAGSIPVTGTFFQATQPVSLAAPVAVTGTFWQTTQPVSGTVAVSGSVAVTGPLTDTQLRATAVPVSGTFWQTTQPVSIASMPSTPVTGTFWQATQPVSGTVTVGNATLAVTQSGTWNIGTVTTLPALPANQSVNISQINAVTPLMGNGATGTGALRVTLSSDQVGTAAALADGLANPTLGPQAVLSSVFNGATWDRQRGMGGNSTTGDTGAKTATGNGATQTNVGNKGVQIVLAMGTVSGTTPTFVLKVQGSADGGTTFYDIPGATTASLVATGTWGITVYPGIAVTAGTTTSGTTAAANMPLPRTWRVVWTIGGTTPSFTITSIQYNYLPN